ncbi:MAG TPA: twin-arginine translocase subunit TatC [Candidatus Saccharimonadales bacterium]|nr:twin-arginine translocase subunit TatC [Candidatus Saccharimonadales bacterium]
MRAKKQRKNQSTTASAASREHNPKLPFIEHLLELRKRLFYVALSVILWSVAAYFVQQHIVSILLRPAHNQQFIYTSVGGGIDFLFRVCLYAGIVFSIPVIVFQVLKYLQPLIKKDAVRFIAGGSVVSGVLAAAGMMFGYFLGLPAALHFLLHQFTSGQIHPLLTIQSYMSFVTLYMLGSALLFQLPLLMVLINRIKPLKPKKLLGYERWVILLAFVGGGIMNPSPRVQDQLMLAVPIILAYQVGVGLVWYMNRGGRSEKMRAMLAKDAAERQQRHSRFVEAQTALQQKMATTVQPSAAAHARQAAPRAAAVVTAPKPTVIHTPAVASVPVAARPAHKRMDVSPVKVAPAATAQPQQAQRTTRTAATSRPISRAAQPPRRAYFNDFVPRRVPAANTYRVAPRQGNSPEAA